jgi:2-amino-4-hydroxy-6-hydroxymethyldihydropteridine diphosphokinase
MNVAFLGLGGNIGDRLETLQNTVKDIGKHCGKIMACSSVYETAAWGSASQKKYLNLVVKLETSFSAPQLLEQLLAIETRWGRQRTSDRNADRTIDIDILFFNAEVITLPEIEIPHPRLHLRKFVLLPMQEIEPDWVHPVMNQQISGLLATCEDNLQIALLQAFE